MPALQSPTSPTLPERVYLSLRDAILNGTYRPGQMLRQEDLAQGMGISRGPLREAMPRLEAEGLVVLHPRRGYAVAQIASAQVIEAFDLRILLECELGQKSIRNRTDADVLEVTKVLEEMARLVKHGDNADRAKWFELNARFHRCLLAPAASPTFQRALDTARGTLEAYVRAEVGFTGDLAHAQNEHQELARLFTAGDSEGFLALTRAHSLHTRDRLLAGLKGSVEPQAAQDAG
ncbi:MAG: GntR family transcriptional regulator [Gammaproteobacteria bacterium]